MLPNALDNRECQTQVDICGCRQGRSHALNVLAQGSQPSRRGGHHPCCDLHQLEDKKCPSRLAPATEAKGQQKAYSLPYVKRWWKDRLEAEYLTMNDCAYVKGEWIGDRPVAVARGALYASFVEDAIRAGLGRGQLPTERQFWDELKECMPGATFQLLKNRRRVPDWKDRGASTVQDRLLLLGPLPECRQAFERWYAQPVKWSKSTDMAAYRVEKEEPMAAYPAEKEEQMEIERDHVTGPVPHQSRVSAST